MCTKTQGKHSFLRQVHYPALPKIGRKEKPALTSRTPLTHIVAMVWHSIQVTSPSIELDVEPETINEFALKQH